MKVTHKQQIKMDKKHIHFKKKSVSFPPLVTKSSYRNCKLYKFYKLKIFISIFQVHGERLIVNRYLQPHENVLKN